MEDTNHETDLEIHYNSEASIGDKRKREGKSRSKVWHHFTKILKEDGRCDKCQCNHCQKIFTCSSRSGTTHLLRHITDGICPVLKKDKERTVTISSYMREQRNGILPWKYEPGLGQTSTQHCMDVEVELLPDRLTSLEAHPLKMVEEDDYGANTPLSSRGKTQPKGEAWMHELRHCVAKLVDLTSIDIPAGSIQHVGSPDYSISAALKCLNEMEDISQSSDTYLDAFEILQDVGERECFICLPPEPRRRWLQRVLHRRHPQRYTSNINV